MGQQDEERLSSISVSVLSHSQGGLRYKKGFFVPNAAISISTGSKVIDYDDVKGEEVKNKVNFGKKFNSNIFFFN